MTSRMHAGELETDAGLVRRLLASRFPEWSRLPIERVPSDGTDNALYRLGDELVVRLPRIDWAVEGNEDAYEWLPRIAPYLPVEVPAPLARGEPAEGYPWPWFVYRWLEGDHPSGRVGDANRLAGDLARFTVALHAVDLPGGPPAGRGGPLDERDEPTREAIAASEGLVDVAAVSAVWEEAMSLPPPSGPPVWVHGDIAGGNLLLRGGRLAAVLDWGGVGLGHPDCDLIVAWNLLAGGAREVYRAGLGVDDDTWLRGRAFALSVALIQLPYYLETNPPLAANARHVVAEVLADAGTLSGARGTRGSRP